MSVEDIVVMSMIHMYSEGQLKSIHDALVVGTLDKRKKDPNDRGIGMSIIIFGKTYYTKNVNILRYLTILQHSSMVKLHINFLF